jgi:hypothetical protein
MIDPSHDLSRAAAAQHRRRVISRAAAPGLVPSQVQPPVPPNLKRAAVFKSWAGPAPQRRRHTEPRRRHLNFDLPISRIRFPAHFCNRSNNIFAGATKFSIVSAHRLGVRRFVSAHRSRTREKRNDKESLTAPHRSRRARRPLFGTRDYRCKELLVWNLI